MFEYVYLVITFEKNKATPVIFKQTGFEGLVFLVPWMVLSFSLTTV